LLGGDPFEPENAENLYPFLIRFRERFGSNKDIWLYTGYTLEDLICKSKTDKNICGVLEIIDILVDGKYEESLKDLSIKFRGSSNQRILKNTHLADINYIDISKDVDDNN
jgi:anaerobic ribonucleoside-triphosphate reductase activating protein